MSSRSQSVNTSLLDAEEEEEDEDEESDVLFTMIIINNVNNHNFSHLTTKGYILKFRKQETRNTQSLIAFPVKKAPTLEDFCLAYQAATSLYQQ